MADLTDLSGLSGEPLTNEQLQGILNQIDLDIANLVRDGKLSALHYGTGQANRGTGRWANRAECLKALLEARQFYQQLLESQPAIQMTQGVTCCHDP